LARIKTSPCHAAGLRIERGHNYPTLIRKSKNSPKLIRVFLGDGANDLDNAFGNWPLANQEMDKALTWAGYDHKFVFGQGFHGDRQMRAIFPDTLKWLWRDWRDTILATPEP
jgi:enterochelin esterase family protein